MVPTIDGYKRAYGSVLCEVANPRKRGYVHSITLNIKFKIMNWRQEQLALEDAFARQMLINYNIKEVTTQRQAKNGTREFEFPVPARKYYAMNKLVISKERLRLAVFKTGYVRNQNSCGSAYQLNPKYKRKVRYVFLKSNGLVTEEHDMWSRALIYSGIARLNFLLQYYLKNYKTNTK